MDDIVTQLREAYEHHDAICAGPVTHLEERWYHQGVRDGIMIALLALQTLPLRFVVETEHTGPAVS